MLNSRDHTDLQQYTLPRQSHPFPKKSPADGSQTQGKTITITIKPMRGGETTTLSNIALVDSIHDVKSKYSQKISLPLDKIKLLHNKKPAADLKTLKDLGIDGDVELGAMLMGGASAETTPIASSAAPTPATKIDTSSADKMEVDSEAPHPGSEKAQAQAEETTTGPSGPGALHTADFWKDLEAFLTQRLKDQAEAEKLTGLFKNAWASQ